MRFPAPPDLSALLVFHPNLSGDSINRPFKPQGILSVTTSPVFSHPRSVYSFHPVEQVLFSDW